ncbi:MAG: amidohydrolase family protein [Rhodospirillaceae bacterium]|nr:amidohydrolase family protein [Rhodospirillaceae bacterium]
MTENITRKEFLRLATVATTYTALAGYPGRASAQNAVPDSVPIAAGSPARTLIQGADVLTMDTTLGERPATDVLLDNGRIEAIGVGLPANGAEVIDARGMILMPGMIDGHRHVWQSIGLGRLTKFHPGDYSANYMLWKMASVVAMEPEDHYIAELVGGLQAIDSGVTSILDYAHGQDTEPNAMAAARGLKDSGIAGWFAYQLGISYAFQPGDTVSGTEAIQAMFAIRSSEQEWNTAALLQKELFHDSSAPLQLALGPAMWAGNPISEFRDEWARIRSTGVGLLVAHLHKPFRPFPAGIMGHRDSGIPDLHEAGLLGPDYHVAHANRLTSEELAMLRDTGGMIAATTMGEFPYMTQAHRGPSVHGRARAAGVPVGIGTDVPLALPDDFFEHVRSSLWSHYLAEESRQIVRDYRSQDTLDFATALGAKAIRLGDETGSITVGKRADLVLLNTGRIGFGKMGGLADRVVTFARTSDIDSVWVAGQARKRHGEMIGVDWASLKTRLHEAQERVGRKVATVNWT